MTVTNIRQTMEQPVAEGGTAYLGWNFKDQTGAVLLLTQIGTVTWTHYNEATGLVINARSNVDIKNNNGGTVHATSGAGTLIVPPADNIIVVAGVPSEWHVAFIRWTYNGGAGVGEKEIVFRVQNMLMV